MSSVVELHGLSFVYPDGRRALNGLDLLVDEGETVGLIGPNGAGKTTLLLHLNGILKGQGDARLFGRPVTKDNLKAIRSRTGIVFQDPDDQLFSSTVFDDVAFGPVNLGLSADEVDRRVKAALTAVELEGYEMVRPHHLSFGEKKRVSIATVLSMQPELLILDEPTSNLDPRQRRNLITLLKKLAGTKIIASHDLTMIKELCRRVVLLNQGAVVCDGAPELIFSDASIMIPNGLEVV